jgi:CheY-specific phosphatase CheX
MVTYTELIERAMKNTFIDIFQSDLEKTDNADIKDYFSSSIDIKIKNNETRTVYFKVPKASLQAMMTAYFFEEDNSDEDLLDFCLEFANLMVGRAKVFAQNENIFFDIATPKEVDNDYIDKKNFDHKFFYMYNGQPLMYAL